LRHAKLHHGGFSSMCRNGTVPNDVGSTRILRSLTARNHSVILFGNRMVTQKRKQREAVFSAIADPTRRQILSSLRGGEFTVGCDSQTWSLPSRYDDRDASAHRGLCTDAATKYNCRERHRHDTLGDGHRFSGPTNTSTLRYRAIVIRFLRTAPAHRRLDGSTAFLFHPHTLLRKLHTAHGNNTDWLRQKVDDLMTTIIEISTPEITMHASICAIHAWTKDGLQYAVVFGREYMLFFARDTQMHTEALADAILDLQFAPTKAVVRFVLSHSTWQPTDLDAILSNHYRRRRAWNLHPNYRSTKRLQPGRR